MNRIEHEREVRRQLALERLGTNDPRCVTCGESDRRCLERHHIAGICHDDETVIVCRNCHRKLSDMQKDHPKPIGSQPDPFERIAYFLLGIADLFELLIERLRQFAATLIAQVRARHTGEAQS
jgi:hypothetical protein